MGEHKKNIILENSKPDDMHTDTVAHAILFKYFIKYFLRQYVI